MAVFCSDNFGDDLAGGMGCLRDMPYFHSAHGDSFARTASSLLSSTCKLTEVTAQDWKNDLSTREARWLAGQYKFEEIDLKLERTIILQPNGSQKFPDALIIDKGSAAGFEFKSNRSDNILWNCGLPRKNSVYVFNGGLGKEYCGTTSFLGQDAIEDEEARILRLIDQETKEFARKRHEFYGLTRWEQQPRPANKTNEKYLTHPARRQREENCDAFLRNLFNPKSLTMKDLASRYAPESALSGERGLSRCPS